MLFRYSRVESACPIARDVRYKILYPLLQMSVYNLAMPGCVQSRPMAAKTCPKASDLHVSSTRSTATAHLVIVPSMSEMTT